MLFGLLLLSTPLKTLLFLNNFHTLHSFLSLSSAKPFKIFCVFLLNHTKLNLSHSKISLKFVFAKLNRRKNLFFILKVIKFLVLPRLKEESKLIKMAIEGTDNAEKKAAEHLKVLLVKHCTPVIYKLLPAQGFDKPEQFVNEYGSMGELIFEKVKQLKIQAMNRQQAQN